MVGAGRDDAAGSFDALRPKLKPGGRTAPRLRILRRIAENGQRGSSAAVIIKTQLYKDDAILPIIMEAPWASGASPRAEFAHS